MRRAVSLAAPLAYQHSLMIFPITRSDCTGKMSFRLKQLIFLHCGNMIDQSLRGQRSEKRYTSTADLCTFIEEFKKIKGTPGPLYMIYGKLTH